MQKHRGYQAPPLVAIKHGPRRAFAQSIKRFAAHSPQDAEAASAACVDRAEKTDTEHQDIHNEQDGGNRRRAAEESGETFAQSCEGESQACAAFVAARRVKSD